MWTEKYVPRTLKDFTGNATAITKCREWMKRFPGTTIADRVLLISGPEGSGKTVAANLLLEYAGYKPHSFTLQDIKNHKKDQRLLDNFCQLYVSDLRRLGVLQGIVIDDFESLTKADKQLHATLVDLITKNLANPRVPPIILTITTALADTSDKRRMQNYQGLAKAATEIVFHRFRNSDLAQMVRSIANVEKLYIEPKVADLIADFSHGDVRRMLQTFELLALGVSSNTGKGRRITNDAALDWLEQNDGDNDQKIVYEVACTGTDEERVLQQALVNTDERVSQSAINIITDNSVQFMPMLFQAYTGVAPLNMSADIAEGMSRGDAIREQAWQFGDGESSLYNSLAALYSIDIPITQLKSLKGLRGSNHVRMRTNGYQAYYGVSNTIQSQERSITAVKQSCHNLSHATHEQLLLIQRKVATALDESTDEKVVAMLEELELHPDTIEFLARIKGDKSVNLRLTKRRKKDLLALFEARQDERVSQVAVKFIEAKKTTKVRPTANPNDPFALKWD